MTLDDPGELAQEIVREARKLSSAHTNQGDAPVNYVCIFTQSQSEYEHMSALAQRLGPVVEETRMGPVFHVAPVPTVAGPLRLLKIRRPDPKRPERGDADFTVSDYPAFKAIHLGKPGFSLIEREHMEMIELIDPSYNVLAYYSHPPLADVLKIRPDTTAEPDLS
jgi:hypothetical protein